MVGSTRASLLFAVAILSTSSIQTSAFLVPLTSVVRLRAVSTACPPAAARSRSQHEGVKCSAEPMGRREALGTFGVAAGLIVGADPQSVLAYCPPNCTGLPSPVEKPVESKKEELQRDDGPVVDLSKPEGQALAKETERVFFDISVGKNTNTSRVVIALYGTVVPKTVQNFKALVTGEKGFGYKGTSFYRIVKGLQISAGDVEGNLGRSGKSALTGGTFDQENFRLLHTMQGMVSMVNTIEKEVDSRFFISTRQEVEPAYSAIFDNKYVAFGRVVEGFDVVLQLDSLDTTGGVFNKGINSGRPKEAVTIQDCGLLPPK